MGGRGRVWERGQLAPLCLDWWRGLSQGREFSFKASTQGAVAVEETVGQQAVPLPEQRDSSPGVTTKT